MAAPFKNRPRMKPAPKICRGYFKYKDGSGKEVDLGLFTKKEEGLAWTRVHQLLLDNEGKVPHGVIEFGPAFQTTVEINFKTDIQLQATTQQQQPRIQSQTQSQAKFQKLEKVGA